MEAFRTHEARRHRQNGDRDVDKDTYTRGMLGRENGLQEGQIRYGTVALNAFRWNFGHGDYLRIKSGPHAGLIAKVEQPADATGNWYELRIPGGDRVIVHGEELERP